MATATRQSVSYPTVDRTKADVRSFTKQRSLLVLWHLLSLDAPTVAALWTWFIARVNHVVLPLSSVFAMAFAVWMLYAADRLLDARLIRSGDKESAVEDRLEARHYFHHLHRSGFLVGISVASIALAFLLPRLDGRAMHLYLVLGGLLAGYFVLIHAVRSERGKVAQRLPKEIAVGIFFAAAAFIPTVARRADLRAELLPEALLFAALCSMNCLFIYAWEHPVMSAGQEAHFATRFALRHLAVLSIVIVVAGAGLTAMRGALWPASLACVLAAILLLLLHCARGRMKPVMLRAAADLVLLTPLLLLPLIR